MLTSARQRAQRVRLGQLVNALRTEQDQEVHASAFDSAAAGSFGCLDPDTACLLLCRLLQVDDYQDSIKGDRTPPAPHEAVLAAVRDAANLTLTCRFLNACMRLHGHRLRLEMAAARCTTFAPSIPLLKTAPFATPWFSQCEREERSRFDVQMLESALVAMVPHCAGEHCRCVRRAHNLRTSEFRAEHSSELILGTQRPYVKVVHDALVSVNATRSNCLLSTEEHGRVRVSVMSDETPDALDPHTELRCRWHTDLPSISDQACVCHHLAMSECGKWVAVVQRRTGPVPAGKIFPDSHIHLYEVGSSGGGPRASHCLVDTLVQTLWFRKYNLDARDAVDGVARTNATLLCFYGSVCCPLTMRSSCWSTVGRLTSWQAPVCTTHVHQYCIEDGAFTNAKLSERGQLEFGHLLCPAGLVAKLPTHDQGDVLANAVEDVTAIISVAEPGCADTTAACIFGIAQFPGSHPFAVAQAVVMDLSYRHRNAAMVGSVTPMMCITDVLFTRMPRRIYLGPRGDLAVVLRGRLVHGASVDFELQVFRRRGLQADFLFLATVPLNQSIRHFRTERSLTNALWSGGLPPRPAWRINVTQPPTSCAFSPCGRFLLLGFTGLTSIAVANQAHLQPAVHASGGVCVLDLSEIWERPPALDLDTQRPKRTVAWIECMSSLVPLRMHWTMAGIWLNTSRGGLLLGTINYKQS
jgi:hypothetical protein